MKSIFYFGLGYLAGGLLIGYSISYLLERSLVYDRNCRTNVGSAC